MERGKSNLNLDTDLSVHWGVDSDYELLARGRQIKESQIAYKTSCLCPG